VLRVDEFRERLFELGYLGAGTPPTGGDGLVNRVGEIVVDRNVGERNGPGIDDRLGGGDV
jgi:hypothetical protein